MTRKIQLRDFELLAREVLSQKQMDQAKHDAKLEHQLMQNIASHVRDAMEKQNIGFNDLVRSLHTSPSQISKILRGDANITLRNLVKLCAALNLDPAVTFEVKK